MHVDIYKLMEPGSKLFGCPR